jgi:hypothetical protein
MNKQQARSSEQACKEEDAEVAIFFILIFLY